MKSSMVLLVLVGLAGSIWADQQPTAAEQVNTAFKQLADPDAEVRRNAVDSLIGSTDPRILPAFLKAAQDPDPNVRYAALNGLRVGKFKKDPRVVPALLKAFKDPDTGVRSLALHAIGNLKFTDARVVQVFLKIAQDQYDEMRVTAISMLGKFHDPQIVPVLLKLAKDMEPGVRQGAIYTLGFFTQDPQVLPTLLKIKTDPDPQMRLAALSVLGVLAKSDSQVLSVFLTGMKDPDMHVRQGMIIFITFNPDLQQRPEVVSALLQAAEDQDPGVRQTAVKHIAPIKHPQILPTIQRLLQDPDPDVRRMAQEAMKDYKQRHP